MPDELAKLAELHKSGALTDDEFRSSKEKLLGSPSSRPPRVVPTPAKSLVKRAAIFTAAFLVVGALLGLMPEALHLPTNAVGEAIFNAVYDGETADPLGNILSAVPWAFAVATFFFFLSWPLLKILRSPVATGLLLAAVPAGMTFASWVLGMLVLFAQTRPPELFGTMGTIVAVNYVTWAVIFTLVAICEKHVGNEAAAASGPVI
ncbi:MAG: SHOCT domain-containing protein [Proteobacteria bacterium]|nr:SHOCT domain-containing protein [Pseudomonadota bacterium]